MPDLVPTWTYSFAHYHYLRRAVSQRSFYAYEPSGPALISRIRRYNRLYAEYRLRPANQPVYDHVSDQEAEEQRNRLKVARNRLTDLDVDVLDILMAYWIDRRRDPEHRVEVDTDEILYARGLQHKVNGQKSNVNAIGRGYTPEQRRAANRSICRLALLWGDVNVIHTHDAEDFVENGDVLDLPSDSPWWDRAALSRFEESVDESIRMQKRQVLRYRPGKLLRRFNLHQHMYHPPAIYNINYRRYFWEKRLARYLYWQWRVNRSQGSLSLVKSVAALLDAVVLDADSGRYHRQEKEETFDIKAEQRPADRGLTYRTRKRFEKALDHLRDDAELIGDWGYRDGWASEWSRKSNWTDLWLSATVRVEPTQNLRGVYGEQDKTGEGAIT